MFKNFPNKRKSVAYVLTEGVEEESSKDHEEADGDLAQVPCAHCLPNHGALGYALGDALGEHCLSSLENSATLE